MPVLPLDRPIHTLFARFENADLEPAGLAVFQVPMLMDPLSPSGESPGSKLSSHEGNGLSLVQSELLEYGIKGSAIFSRHSDQTIFVHTPNHLALSPMKCECATLQ